MLSTFARSTVRITGKFTVSNFYAEQYFIKAVIEQVEPGAASGDIQDDRGGYRKSSETVDVLTDRILELVKNQNEY